MLNFFTKALIKRQLKGKIPEGEMDAMITMIEKNPDYFKQMAMSIEAKIKSGMSQEQAAMEVMQNDKVKLQEMLGK